jgi:surface protein
MFGTFYRATAFNQPLNLRTPNNVIDMKVIFYGAANFNQDISSWNVENVQEFGWLDPNTTTYQGIFDNTNLSTYNYNAILS